MLTLDEAALCGRLDPQTVTALEGWLRTHHDDTTEKDD
jgi:hypothetical protein